MVQKFVFWKMFVLVFLVCNPRFLTHTTYLLLIIFYSKSAAAGCIVILDDSVFLCFHNFRDFFVFHFEVVKRQLYYGIVVFW